MYKKTNWVDNVTLVDASSLNKIENQLELLESLLIVESENILLDLIWLKIITTLIL